MASPRLKEGLFALALALVLLAAVYSVGAPWWSGWIAAGVALVVAEVAGRLFWHDAGDE